MNKKETFINDKIPYAKKASEQLKDKGINIDYRYILAHWGHETGYGNNTGAKNNNLSGIFAYPSSPYGINGKKYTDLNDFVWDYVNVVSNKRYASNINNTKNVTDFAKGLKAGGYASDPNYAYSGNWLEGFNIATKLGGGTPVENIGGTGNQNSSSGGTREDGDLIPPSTPLAELDIWGKIKFGMAQVMVFIILLFSMYVVFIKK